MPERLFLVTARMFLAAAKPFFAWAGRLYLSISDVSERPMTWECRLFLAHQMPGPSALRHRPRICSTGRALSLTIPQMKAKLVTTICVLAICLGSVASARASENSGPLTVTVDAVVIRPACLVATALGSAVFVVALPVAAVSKSVKKTANTLVVKPANATFTRPLGDMDALVDY